MIKTHHNRSTELAPCGVYCGACPSFGKSCFGCASGDHSQKRSSKWNCKIRNCCYNDKELDYCIDCNEFPCKLINKKLVNSHPGDERFSYRHEIPTIFPKLKTMSVEEFTAYQKRRWTCSKCDGTIRFYHYTCDQCGDKSLVTF